MPHVTVASRLGNEKSLVGSLIHYIICQKSDAKSLSDQAYHPKEYQKS